MIKQGRIKLNIDISDFLLNEEQDIFQAEDVDESNPPEPKNVPFISYVEGSYFGDSDIFRKSNHLERDSTAIAECESHFFVLSREVIIQLRKTFPAEILQMSELAKKRKLRHQQLIKALKIKVDFI